MTWMKEVEGEEQEVEEEDQKEAILQYMTCSHAD